MSLIFDLFRVRRRIFKTPDIVTYIQDVLFWIITGFIVVYTITQYTDGEIRSYMLIGLLVGIIVYFVYISKWVIKVLVSVSKSAIKLFFSLFQPFKKMYKLIKKTRNKNII